MNDKVDTRVVRMEFDNKQFEKNIKQTSKSLDNLKQSLNFDGIGDGLDKLKVKISALNVVTTTFIVNITNKVIKLGTTLVKSLSVDNIAAGWTKFGEKTVSVATMMAQKIRIAGQEIEDYAQKTEIVNNLLEKLAWFADETSYSLSDMTEYASKFIAAGVDLDKAINAMEGIATWAAMAGQNSQKASQAMIQLSQAMGRTINKQDWNSISNAGMDTEIFREKVLETAVALGQLTKEGDKFVTKTGKKFDKAGFANYFSEGWFTSDVLVETLNKYSAAVDQIYQISIDEGLTASEVIEKYGDVLDDFGKQAFLAAQEARTFNDVLNSVKDAVSSKWMQTFELFFGGKDEAVKLWTELANQLYDVFAESGNFRNSMLSIWKEMGGRDDIFGAHGEPNQGAFWNIYDAIIAIKDAISSAWNTIFPISEMESESDQAKDIARNVKGITNSLRILTESMLNTIQNTKVITNVFEAFFKVVRAGLVLIQGIKYSLEPIYYTLKRMATEALYRVASLVGGIDGILNHIIVISNKLNKMLWSIMDVLDPSYVLASAFNLIEKIYNLIAEFDPLGKLIKFTEEFFRGLKDGGATEENFIKITKSVFSLINILSKAFIKITAAITKYVLPILDKLVNIVGYVVGVLAGAVVYVTALVADIITAINELIEGVNDGIGLSDSIKQFFTSIPGLIEKSLPVLTSLAEILKTLVEVLLLVPETLNSISVQLTGKSLLDNITDFVTNLKEAIQALVKGNDIKLTGGAGTLYGFLESIIVFFEGLRELVKALISVIQASLVVIGSTLKVIGKAIQYLSDIIIKVFTGNFKGLTESQQILLTVVTIFGSIVAVTWMLYSIFYSWNLVLNPFGSLIDSLIDGIDSLRLSILIGNIKKIGLAMLEIAVAFRILDKTSDRIKSAALTMTTIALIFVGLSSIAGSVLSAIVSLKQKFTEFNIKAKDYTYTSEDTVATIKSDYTIVKQMAKILLMFSAVVAELTAVALIFDHMKDPDKAFNSMMGVFWTVIGFMATMGLIMMRFNKSSGKMLPAIFKGNEVTLKDWKLLNKDLGKIALILVAFSVTLGAIAGSIALVAKAAQGATKEAGLSGSEVEQTASQVGSGGNSSSSSSSGMNPVWTAVLALTAIFEQIVGAALLLSKVDTKFVLPNIMMLGALTTALVAAGGAIAMLGKIPEKRLWTAMGVVSILMAVVGGIFAALNFLPTSATASNPLPQIMTMGAITLALIAVAGSIAMLGKIPVAQMWTAMGVISILMAIMGGILAGLNFLPSKSINQFFKVGAALVALSLGILALAGAMRILSKVDLLTAGIGLAACVVSLGALVGLAVLLTKATKAMDALISMSYVFMVIAGSAALLALALAALLQSIDKLSDADKVMGAFRTLGLAIGEFITQLINKVIPALLQGLYMLLEGLIKVINEYTMPLATAVVQSILQILGYIVSVQDKIFEVLGQLIMGALRFTFELLLASTGYILDQTMKLLEIITDHFVNNIGKVTDMATRILFAVIDAILDELPTIMEGITRTAVKGIINFWNGLMDIFGIEGLSITEEQFKEFVQNIVNFINTFIDIFKQYYEAVKPIYQFIGDIIKELLPLLLGSLGPAIEVLATIIQALLKLLTPIIDFLMSDIIGPVLQFVIISIKALAGLLELTLGPILETIGEFLTAILKSVGLLLSGDMSGLSDLWQGFADKIINIWKGFGDRWTSFWTKFWEENQEGIKVGGRIILGILTGGLSEIVLLIVNNFDKIKAFFVNVFNFLKKWLYDKPVEIILKVYNFLKKWLYDKPIEGLTKIIKTVKAWWNKITSFLSGTVNTIKNTASNIINGFVNGIKNGWNTVKNTVSSLGQKIKDWWCNLWGIHSPSTVFAEYGKYMMEGLSIGLTEGANKEKRVLDTTFRSLIDTVDDILNHGDDFTIKVGMDISAVESQTNNIRGLMSSISNYDLNGSTGAYQTNASRIAKDSSKFNKESSSKNGSSEVYNDNTTNNNVFNITSNNPKAVADEVDKVLQKRAMDKKIARGGI